MAASSGPSANGNGQAAAGGAPLSHREWVRRAVDRYERPLVSYAAHLAGDVERGRDVVQETFLRLCDARRDEVEPRLAQWLFTVTRNLAFDARRKERRMRMLRENEAAALDPMTPADTAAQDDSVSHVLKCLADLPPVQQEVIRLKFQHGLSYREIGEVMTLTATNVGFLIHTGLKTLRQRLTRDEPGVRSRG